MGLSSSGSHFVWHRHYARRFKHEPLDDLLWQFMIGYYQQCEGAKVKFWQNETSA